MSIGSHTVLDQYLRSYLTRFLKDYYGLAPERFTEPRTSSCIDAWQASRAGVARTTERC
jgi:hypothetical protein